jgi:hypothetical protein
MTECVTLPDQPETPPREAEERTCPRPCLDPDCREHGIPASLARIDRYCRENPGTPCSD